MSLLTFVRLESFKGAAAVFFDGAIFFLKSDYFVGLSEILKTKAKLRFATLAKQNQKAAKFFIIFFLFKKKTKLQKRPFRLVTVSAQAG